MYVRRSLALATALAILAAPGLSAASSPGLIPTGTRATLALKGWLSSKDASVGDTFEAWLVNDISVEGQLVVPAGAIFVGRVAAVQPAKARSRGGELTLIFDKLVSGDGRSAASPATVSGLVEGTETEGKDNTAQNAGIGGAVREVPRGPRLVHSPPKWVQTRGLKGNSSPAGGALCSPCSASLKASGTSGDFPT